MEKTYYLISCEDREENNIGVVADRRDMKGRLQDILRTYFDDEEIEVHSIEQSGKDYEKKFIAECTDYCGTEFTVQLEQTILFD